MISCSTILHEYIIVTDMYLSTFLTTVNTRLTDGYNPLGAPFKDGIYWHQAMTKSHKETVTG